MNKTFVKGLITTLIAFIVGYISQTQSINYTYLAFYVVAYTLWYLGKNYIFPSTSLFGTINIWDIVSGLILAIGGALISLAGQWMTTTVLDWHQVWVTVYASALSYLAIKFGFNSKGTIGQSSDPVVQPLPPPPPPTVKQ